MRLSYPTKTQLSLKGPTLIYIDDEDNLNEVELNRDQVQMLIDDWNEGADVEDYQLRPPLDAAVKGSLELAEKGEQG